MKANVYHEIPDCSFKNDICNMLDRYELQSGVRPNVLTLSYGFIKEIEKLSGKKYKKNRSILLGCLVLDPYEFEHRLTKN